MQIYVIKIPVLLKSFEKNNYAEVFLNLRLLMKLVASWELPVKTVELPFLWLIQLYYKKCIIIILAMIFTNTLIVIVIISL